MREHMSGSWRRTDCLRIIVNTVSTAHRMKGSANVVWDVKWDCREAIQFREVLLRVANSFRSWLQDSQEIFWISGKAGAGKSSLMKFLLEHKATTDRLHECASQDVTRAGFFFWAAGGDLESSHIGLLRSLMHQILQSQPHLIEGMIFGMGPFDIEQPWTVRRLDTIFYQILKNATLSTSFAFFIDGLDEFKGDISDLLGALGTMNQSPNIKLCVSSRPWNVFENEYGSRASNLHLRLHEVNRIDIDNYIKGRLVDDTNLNRAMDPETNRELATLSAAIREKAEGVFLWVNLVVQRLRKAVNDSWKISEMLQLVDQMPAELEDLIQRIFDRIDPIHCQKAARSFLLLLECEKHIYGNLHLLWLSIFDGGDMESTGNDGYPLPQSYLDRMVSDAELSARKWCGDLVNVVRGARLDHSQAMVKEQTDKREFRNYVQFPHRTIRDFIETKKNNGNLLEIAGDGFCPAYSLCSALLQVARCVDCDDVAWSRLFQYLVHASKGVNEVHHASLVDIAQNFNTLAQDSSGALGHWSMGNQGFAHFVGGDEYYGGAVDERTGAVLFMAYIIFCGGLDLFQLTSDSTKRLHNAESAQVWLGAMIISASIWEGVIDGLLTAIPIVLQLGADLNKPLHNTAKWESAWQGFLHSCHCYVGLNNWNIIDVLLLHGANPNVDLEVDHLYPFLLEPHRSIEVSALLPNSVQRFQSSSSLSTGFSSHGNEQQSGSRRQDVTATPTGRLVVPATAAFEVPSENAIYAQRFNREIIPRIFPIIKAKLIAASEEKARRQRMENETAAGTSTPKRKRSDSHEGDTGKQRQVGSRSMSIRAICN